MDDLGDINGIDQWSTITDEAKTRRNSVLLNIDEVLNISGVIGMNGRYKYLLGKWNSKNVLYLSKKNFQEAIIREDTTITTEIADVKTLQTTT